MKYVVLLFCCLLLLVSCGDETELVTVTVSSPANMPEIYYTPVPAAVPTPIPTAAPTPITIIIYTPLPEE